MLERISFAQRGSTVHTLYGSDRHDNAAIETIGEMSFVLQANMYFCKKYFIILVSFKSIKSSMHHYTHFVEISKLCPIALIKTTIQN